MATDRHNIVRPPASPPKKHDPANNFKLATDLSNAQNEYQQNQMSARQFIMSGTVPSLAANIEKPPGTPIDPADAERVKLFQPFKQKSVTLHNRLGVSPMCI
ncbi:hypothetical protein G6F42_027787 [Rhizopus arrhizus]|nr:hypothetical protein G6F42_027787 [Rhizopus arrhizus]